MLSKFIPIYYEILHEPLIFWLGVQNLLRGCFYHFLSFLISIKLLLICQSQSLFCNLKVTIQLVLTVIFRKKIAVKLILISVSVLKYLLDLVLFEGFFLFVLLLSLRSDQVLIVFLLKLYFFHSYLFVLHLRRINQFIGLF